MNKQEYLSLHRIIEEQQQITSELAGIHLKALHEHYRIAAELKGMGKEDIFSFYEPTIDEFIRVTGLALADSLQAYSDMVRAFAGVV